MMWPVTHVGGDGFGLRPRHAALLLEGLGDEHHTSESRRR